MREEVKEVIQLNLENFAMEKFNDAAKGDCLGVKIENPFLKYYQGWLNGVCMVLNLTMEQEGHHWVIKNGRHQVIAQTGVEDNEE